MIFISKSLEDTNKIGEIIGKSLLRKAVICLDGDLGAGKTTLVQAIAKTIGVTDYVTSPTFTIIKEYECKYGLYHMDAYRISSDAEMYDLGYEEYINSDGVCIIEWGSNIKNLMPEYTTYINIKVDYSKECREIEITGNNNIIDRIRILKEQLGL